MYPCCFLFNLGVCLRVILTKLSDFVDSAKFINVGSYSFVAVQRLKLRVKSKNF